jgi:anti-sigma factor RsiW
MSADRYREWDAAYVLGALSPEERLEFEGHLAECADCTAAVAESAGVPGVLRRLDTATAIRLRDLPEAAPVADVAPANVARIASGIRRRRRMFTTAAAAAIVAALGGGVGGGLTVGAALAGHSPASTSTTAQLHPVGGSEVSASLTMASIAEGTRLDWRCKYPAQGEWSGTTAYRLVVQTKDGAWSTVATWSGRGSGTTVDGLSTVTSIPRQDIRAVEIRLPGEKTALAAVRL